MHERQHAACSSVRLIARMAIGCERDAGNIFVAAVEEVFFRTVVMFVMFGVLRVIGMVGVLGAIGAIGVFGAVCEYCEVLVLLT